MRLIRQSPHKATNDLHCIYPIEIIGENGHVISIGDGTHRCLILAKSMVLAHHADGEVTKIEPCRNQARVSDFVLSDSMHI